jgi:hypothetical protein
MTKRAKIYTRPEIGRSAVLTEARQSYGRFVKMSLNRRIRGPRTQSVNANGTHFAQPAIISSWLLLRPARL